MIEKVIKRNGSIVNFNINKIDNAIYKAFKASNYNNGNFTKDEIYSLTLSVTNILINYYKNTDYIFNIEDIQDTVENILIKNGYNIVAKKYILYRDKRAKIRNTDKLIKDMTYTMKEYLEKENWRINENANIDYSLGGLILHNSGSITANYWLNNIYTKNIKDAHINGDLHIHDLSFYGGYCSGWSLFQLIQQGLGGIPNKITSSPAKHLSTICQQIVNFLGILQNEWAGAQAFSSFDTYLAPFVKIDNLNEKEVKQCIQSFVYGSNTPSRWGCVDIRTEVLSINGFKKYNELKENDVIYTWNKGILELQKVNKIIIKKFEGKMHSYIARNYNQTVTPNHRVLTYKHNTFIDKIQLSKNIFNVKTPYRLPTMFYNSNIYNNKLSNEEIILAALIYTDGFIDFRKKSIHKIKFSKSPNRYGNNEIKKISKKLKLEFILNKKNSEFGLINEYIFYNDSARFIYKLIKSKKYISDCFVNTLSKKQALLFLKTWSKCDGDSEDLQYDNEIIASQLQQIAVHAGYTSYIIRKKCKSGKYINYIKLRKNKSIIPTIRKEVDCIDNICWCPNVDNGTAVFRKNGNIFVSGQTQTPFTNITFDWNVPDDMKNKPAIVGGISQDFTYNDCQKEMDIINKTFIEIILEGDAANRGFSYPIPTYNITEKFDWNHPNCDLLFKMTGKYGTPYFQNFINSTLNPNDVRSMCCRLRLDKRELRNRGGGLFGSDEFTGSIGVVTLNLARIGYLSKNFEDFKSKLDNILNIAKNSLEIKRDLITKLLKKGLFPYTKHYLRNFNNHFSTIGVIGMNECVFNFFLKDLTHKECINFSIEILKYIKDKLIKYQKETGNLYNLEATPGEGTSYRLAKIDKKTFPNMYISGEDNPYYTNSSQLPVNATNSIFKALDMQLELQKQYTGGTVFHVFLGEQIENSEVCKELVKKIAKNYSIPYFTISPTYSICKNHGYIIGKQEICNICGNKNEVYSRIVGYYRPISNWNLGKKEEFKNRNEFINE